MAAQRAREGQFPNHRSLVVPGLRRTRNLAMDTSQSPEILRQDRGDQALSNPALALQQDVNRCSTVSIIDCFCHSSPLLRAPTFSHSVYPANENQACFLLVVLDSQ